ncbi:hypothetical protein BD408DRAFT_319010, partial [Parasitella parasitica]
YWVQRISRQVPGTSYVRTQFPIIPAFASTIHKSQSMTIDCSRTQAISTFFFFFFGADLPLNIKRKYGLDADAIEIV